jgi:hypothetical protein
MLNHAESITSSTEQQAPDTAPPVDTGKPQPAEGKCSMRTPNSEVYAHIETERIVSLHRQGLSQRKIGKLLGMGPCSVGNRLRQHGIRGGRVVRVTAQQLRDARLDPALEARLDIRDRVICRECGELKASINASAEHSHLRRDKMTVQEYTRKYPGARFFSFARTAEQARRQGRNTTLEELMQQFAAKYVAAVELRQCRRDPFWERRRGMTDIVVCRRCGLKIGFNNLSGHVRRDGYEDLAAYRADFPNAPSTPIAYKERYLRPYAKERYLQKQTKEKAPQARRGQPRKTEEAKSYAAIGRLVEERIPANLKDSRRAVIAARQAIATENPDFEADVVAEYHKRYRRLIRNRNLG